LPTRKRIAICEDSKAYAAALKGFLARDPDIEVVGIFDTAEKLLNELDRLDPDLVTMDLELPGIDGVEATGRIMKQRPTPVLVISSHAGKRSERTAQALAAGALDAVQKDRINVREPDSVWAIALRSRIKRLGSLQLKRRAQRQAVSARTASSSIKGRPAQVVAIGASTGGPPALGTVLEALPADFPMPVMVVQHIAPGFVQGLVQWLAGRVRLPVGVAEQGLRASPGIWFAPDDAHLLLDAQMRFALDPDTVSGSHRPSVDVLFESVAASAGDEVFGVVLTGMGRDGGAGTEAIRSAGGFVIAQDEATSAVYGMPRAAAEAGADLSLPLEEIGPSIAAVRVAGVSQR
jgi:two-component system, chemotaxis family, protein-glutamate methylesterase/glutaminase